MTISLFRSGLAGALAVVLALLLSPPGSLQAQSGSGVSLIDWDAERVEMTRDGLEELLERLEEASRSSAYSSRLRGQAEAEARMVRQRLEEGDLRVGDQVVLHVRDEPDLDNTFTVLSGRVLSLPLVGEVPMEGVLRSEVEEHLREHISDYIREPVVRAHSLLRVSVTGEVGSPGFYVVQADALVSDVLTQAGGPTRDARLHQIRVERGNQRIWDGEALETAIIQGRTLDQLNLRAGDRIYVPREAHRTRWELARNIAWVLGPTLSLIFAIDRLF